MESDTRIENGVIVDTSLGNEDHGIFTAFLTIEGDGWGCGFGGYAFDTYDKQAGDRVGHAYGMQFIMEVLKTLEISSWEKLKGAHVRVESQGWGGGIIKIGPVIKNRWFDPKALADKMKAV